MSIINEEMVEVFSNEPKFDEFACMHQDKWIELTTILQDARIPREVKTQLMDKLEKITRKFEYEREKGQEQGSINP